MKHFFIKIGREYLSPALESDPFWMIFWTRIGPSFGQLFGPNRVKKNHIVLFKKNVKFSKFVTKKIIQKSRKITSFSKNKFDVLLGFLLFSRKFIKKHSFSDDSKSTLLELSGGLIWVLDGRCNGIWVSRSGSKMDHFCSKKLENSDISGDKLVTNQRSRR